MDVMRLFIAIVIAGLAAWMLHLRFSLVEDTAPAPLTMQNTDVACAQVESLLAGSTTEPTESQRARQECRKHICNMSFLHDRSLLFPREENSEAENADNQQKGRMLKGAFVGTQNQSSATYDFTCYYTTAQKSGQGLVVQNVMVVPRP